VPRWLRDKGGALLHLAELKTGKFVASYATLAEKWGVGRRQAIRIAQRLHKEHALKFEHRFAKPHPKAKPRPKNQTCNAWELTVPKSWLTEPGPDAPSPGDDVTNSPSLELPTASAPDVPLTSSPPAPSTRPELEPEEREILHVLLIMPKLQHFASASRAKALDKWRLQHGKGLAAVLVAIRAVATKHGEQSPEQQWKTLLSFVQCANPERDETAVLAQLAELDEVKVLAHDGAALAERLIKDARKNGHGLSFVLERVREAAPTSGKSKNRKDLAAHLLASVRGTSAAPVALLAPADPGPRRVGLGGAFFTPMDFRGRDPPPKK